MDSATSLNANASSRLCLAQNKTSMDPYETYHLKCPHPRGSIDLILPSNSATTSPLPLSTSPIFSKDGTPLRTEAKQAPLIVITSSYPSPPNSANPSLDRRSPLPHPSTS